MLLIAREMINSARKRVGQLIADRDGVHIRQLARRHCYVAAAVVDLSVGHPMDHEFGDLLWLVEDELGSNARLGIDMFNPDVMEKAMASAP